MRIQYDSEVDALYIEFRSVPPGTAKNRVISEDITADYGPDGKLIGIEVLDASAVLGEEVSRVIVELAPTKSAAAR